MRTWFAVSVVIAVTVLGCGSANGAKDWTTDFKKAAKWVAKEKPGTVSVFVLRGYRTSFVFIQPDYND